MKPTNTTNRLHFEDLSPSRFEDLSLAMVYRISRWVDINHFGRQGNDDGIDIHATEELDNNSSRTWFIQCKRYKRISKTELTQVVAKVIERSQKPPDIILLVLACDISKSASDHFKSEAKKRGINRALIWSASVIEMKLYSEYHDLLFAYFGISLSSQRRDRISTIRRNIRMKERMKKDLISKSQNPQEASRRPYKQFAYSRVIIHSIDDKLYPEIDENAVGISPWFRIELYDFYHNGIEVTIGIEKAIFNDNDEWDVVRYGEQPRKAKYNEANVFVIGRIPYEYIIEYDLNGDEYYNHPHIYCDFRNNGEPYEEIVYSLISKESKEEFTYDIRLDKTKRSPLP